MHFQEIDSLAASQDGRLAVAGWSCVEPPGSNIEGQLTGAVAYSQSGPVAAAHGRRLPGELKTIVAILDALVTETILTHLRLHARAPPRSPARGQALQAA